MANTLRSLAGDKIFKTSDVISALHKPLTPEERVLDRYVFLPHARTGIAAALDTPFAWSLPVRVTVNMRVPVVDDRGGVDAEMTVHVYGPADVTEVDVAQEHDDKRGSHCQNDGRPDGRSHERNRLLL